MRLLRGLAFLLSGAHFSEVTSGYQVPNRAVWELFAAARYPADYADADVLVMLTRAESRIAEVRVRMYPKRSGQPMHAGRRPICYTFKMLLSMLPLLLRNESHDRIGS